MIFVIITGRMAPDASIRQFLWSLTRHKAKRASGTSSYNLRSVEEWDYFTRGRQVDRKIDANGSLTETFMLCDPSMALSFEEIGRPTIRSQRRQPGEYDSDIGCGNVRLFAGRKWAGLLGAEMKRTRRCFTSSRVSMRLRYYVLRTDCCMCRVLWVIVTP